MSALVVDDTRPPWLSTALQRLQIAESTTERVALQWPQVSGVQRYRFYRAGADRLVRDVMEGQ